MASIHKNGTNFHLSFRLGKVQFKPSLKTTSTRVAENIRGQVEETIKLIERGQIALPIGAKRSEIVQFILSGGKITEKPVLDLEGKPTLTIVIDEYFAHYTTGKEEITVKGERSHANHFLRMLGAETTLDTIDYDRLQKDYVNKRAKEDGHRRRTISGETINKELRTLAQIWKMAKRKGYVDHDMPKVEVTLTDEKPPFMTWDQIEAIIKMGGLNSEEEQDYWDRLFLDETQVLSLLADVKAHAEHPFIYVGIAIAAFTGARRSEIMRSRIEDWDFSNLAVSIREKKGSRKQRITFRKLPMHPKLAAILQEWRANHHPGSSYMVAIPAQLPRSKTKTDKPSPMTRDQAHNHFKDTLADTKWKVLRGWHVLRHSFCSNCARKSVPDLIIDSWMGHRGDEAIKKRYRHLFPCDERQFIESLFFVPS